jgi:hypothetical protein
VNGCEKLKHSSGIPICWGPFGPCLCQFWFDTYFMKFSPSPYVFSLCSNVYIWWNPPLLTIYFAIVSCDKVKTSPRKDQYSETYVMHFLFNLLRIKGLHMFWALLAHPQEVLHKQHLVYCMRVMSVGCTRVGVFHSNTCNIPSVICGAPPEDEQVMLKTCRGP